MTTLQFADTYNLVAFLSKPTEREVQLQALVDGKKINVTEASVRRDLQLNDEEGTDCFPNATIFEELTRMGSRRPKRKDIEVPQSSGPTDNVADEAVNEEMDDSLVRAATTAFSLDAEQDRGKINKTQPKEDASKQGRKIDDIDKDAEIKLVHETQRRYGDEEMFDIGVLDGDEVLAEPEVIVKDVNLSVDEVTLAQALATLKSAKVQKKANVVEEPSESITTTPTLTTTTAATTIIAVKEHDKGKGIIVEEPIKMKKKDQISLDEEVSFKLQAKEEEEERLVREKAQQIEEANIVAWDNVEVRTEGSETIVEGSSKRAGEELE
ncbi:hypothetical protein Tco_1393025 [Tanacetum coccineum]